MAELIGAEVCLLSVAQAWRLAVGENGLPELALIHRPSRVIFSLVSVGLVSGSADCYGNVGSDCVGGPSVKMDI